MTNLSSLSPAYITADATAAATDIITPKTAYGSAGKLTGTALDPSTRTAVASDLATGKTAISAGGALTGTGVYSPAMMQFDGSTGYYSKTGITTSGNSISFVLRFSILNNSGTQSFLWLDDGTNVIGWIKLSSSGYIQIFIYSSTAVNIVQLQSTSVFDDGIPHTSFISYDGTAGTASFIIDGVDQDDTGFGTRVLTTGTLPSGASSRLWVGVRSNLTEDYAGDMGFFGLKSSYLTNWSDFMTASGAPKELDESTWTEWGAQPLFWNEHGDMVNNLGSAGAMTKNGTINVGKGGNYV